MLTTTDLKVIGYDRITKDFMASYDGNVIGFFPSYSAADEALNDYVLGLCQDGLIDQPMAALADAQALDTFQAELIANLDPETPDPSPPPWDAPAIVRKTIIAWQCNRVACAQWLATFNDAEQRMLVQAIIAYRRQFFATELTVDRLVGEWRRVA